MSEVPCDERRQPIGPRCRSRRTVSPWHVLRARERGPSNAERTRPLLGTPQSRFLPETPRRGFELGRSLSSRLPAQAGSACSPSARSASACTVTRRRASYRFSTHLRSVCATEQQDFASQRTRRPPAHEPADGSGPISVRAQGVRQECRVPAGSAGSRVGRAPELPDRGLPRSPRVRGRSPRKWTLRASSRGRLRPRPGSRPTTPPFPRRGRPRGGMSGRG